MTLTTDVRDRYEEGLNMIPSHMHEGVRAYIEKGVPPGDFLMSVLLTNDFTQASMSADMLNAKMLREWAEFVVWYLPSIAHGSPERVQKWIASGGLSGPAYTEEKTDA